MRSTSPRFCSSTPNPGRTAAARSVNRRTDGVRRACWSSASGSGSGSGPSGTRASPSTAAWFPAGGQHPQPGAAGQQGRDQVRDGVDEVLAVVHHEQALPAVQLVGQHVQFADRVAAQPGRGLEQGRAAQPDRDEQRPAGLGRVGDMGEVDQPGAVGVRPAVAPGGLDGEARLAGCRGDRGR